MMIFPQLPFDAEESPLSYASRSAKYHIGDRVVGFLRDFDITPQDMAANKKEPIARLADITGVPSDKLLANAAIALGERTYDLRGELVTAEFLANPHTMFCPACLAEDDERGERRGRWLWTLSVFRTCPRHEIPLMRRAKSKWDDPFHELDFRVPERGDDLKALVEDAETRSVSALQEYVTKRILGKNGPGWLDSQTLDQATRVTEYLGVLVAYGPAQKLPLLTADDRDHAGRVGFEFTCRGEEGIREVLEAQFRKFADATGTPGARRIFGFFYNSIAHSKSLKDPGDIARILRQVITDNIAMPSGTKVLGVKLPERYLHTVASLAKEQNLDSRTLNDVLIAAGALPKNARAHFPIPVKQGREVADRIQRMVNVISLPDALVCAFPLIKHLFADRLLTPIYYGRPGAKGHTQKGVDSEEIAKLVGKLQANATLLGSEVDGLVSISKAAEKAKILGVTVVHMILGRFIDHVFCVTGVEGIAALRVDPAEIKKQASCLSWGCSITEAAGSLKLSPQIVWHLLDHHSEEVSMQVHWISCPSTHHRIPRIAPEEIADFKKRFIHPARIAEQCDLRVCEVESRLKRRRIRPVATETEVGENFYRASALELGFFI